MGRSLLFVVTFVLLAPFARAADVVTKPEIDLQLFWPVAGANDLITVETGDVNSHLGTSLGLSLNYARNPLAVQIIRDDGTKSKVGAIVANRIDTQLVAALGFFAALGALGSALAVALAARVVRRLAVA